MIEWISVDEVYPGEGEYLCLLACGSINIKQKQVVRKITESDVKRNNINFGDWVRLTHWMPLPEPPKL